VRKVRDPDRVRSFGGLQHAAVLEAVHTWDEKRAPILEAIRGLRELCETLSDQLAELRWRQLGTQLDSPHAAYREMKQWANEECAGVEAAGGSRDDEGKEEPFEIPPLHALRQT
jgi:hypothetical protein